MSVRSLLTRGLSFLRRSGHGETFTIDNFVGSFTGFYEEVNNANTLDTGGFLPTANAILYVERSEFSFTPWVGMKVRIDGRQLLVTEVGKNRYRWRLPLMQAHPKATSDVPAYIDVVSTKAGTPVLGPTNNPQEVVPPPAP